jgi:hypothetical protein
MKTVVLEIEDSKFEQFMTMINLLKSDVVKKFEIKKEKESSSMENELLEDLELYKSGQLATIEISAIKSDIITSYEVQPIDEEDVIDEKHCMEVLGRINRGDYAGIEPIGDIDKHIAELKNAIG